MTVDNIDNIEQICRKNIDEGFRLIMYHYQELMYHHIRRMLVNHEDTQDALQETFLNAYNSLSQFRFESSVSTWLYIIATRECLRILRQKQRQFVVDDDEQTAYLMNQLMAGDYIDYENEMAVKFQQAILMLPERQRLVFNLRYYDELEYEEIAKILDSSVNTLKVNYHYAKEKIKEYILKH